MERRRAEFERQEKARLDRREKRLLAQYNKAAEEKDYFTMKMVGFRLQSEFGYDMDYIPGLDDGEQIERRPQE